MRNADRAHASTSVGYKPATRTSRLTFLSGELDIANSPRVLAICLFRHASRILVAKGFDGEKDEHFLRPIGGAVEFGERAADAIRREVREELGVEITSPVRLGVLENLFTYQGVASHEIVFVFDAQFVDISLYGRETLPLEEDVWVGPARWLDLLAPATMPLYPDGLLDLLSNDA